MKNLKERIVISELRKNARMRLTDIAKKAHMPISSVFELLKKLKGKSITKYTVLVHFASLGFHCRANVLFKIHPDDRERLQEHLIKHPHVNSIYKINNGYDLLIDCIFQTLHEFEQFMESLDEEYSIKCKEVHHILDDIKRETFMDDDTLIPIIYKEQEIRKV